MASALDSSIQTGYSSLTYSDIADFTGKTLSSTEQTVVTSLIKDIEAFIIMKIGRNLNSSVTYYKTYDAGYNKYLLRNTPIDSITQLDLDGSDILSNYTLGTDYFVYDNYVEFDTQPTSSIDNRQALKIYYTIKDVVGDDIKLAITRWVSDLLLTKEYAGKSVKNFSAGAMNINFNNDLPIYIDAVIQSYKSYNL